MKLNLTKKHCLPAWLRSLLLFSLVLSPGMALSQDTPWYAVEAAAGVLATGDCTEVTSGAQIYKFAQLNLAQIISEKKVDGKVVEMTFRLQGRQGTIYRDRQACEAVASEAYQRQSVIPQQYR